MPKKISKLPKWAIKQAGGINKKAWALARRGRGGRSTPRGRSSPSNAGSPRRRGIIAKINAFTRGVKLALPAIGSAMSQGLNQHSPRRILGRYTGYDLNKREFDLTGVKRAAGFYAGNVVEAKVMSAVRIPQMAGRKKILAVAAQYLPEISAAPHAIAGNFGEAVNQYGRASVGYQATDHQSWVENGTVRNEWLKNLGARIGLGLFSRFVGPMVNKYTPKGINF